jgi:hypothetical protein
MLGFSLTARAEFADVTDIAGIRFVHNNGSSGQHYFEETVGSGCCWIDYDRDGFLDLYYVNACDLPGRQSPEPARNALFRNRGDGTFEDMTDKAGVGDTGYGVGVVAADYDNDGWTDLYVCNQGPNLLYRNRGDGTFENVAAEAGVAGDDYSASAVFLDFDRDGRLDIYVANYIDVSTQKPNQCTRIVDGKTVEVYCAPQRYTGIPDRLYRGRGDGTFADISAGAGIDEPALNGLGVVCGDLTGNGLTDIYVGNDAGANFLWENQGDGTFVDSGLLSLTAYGVYGDAENGMGVAIGDFDRDGVWDVVVNNFDAQPTSLYRGLGGGFFEHVSWPTGVAEVTIPRLCWGLLAFDYDNDAWEDLFVGCGHIYENVELFQDATGWAQPDALLRNKGGGSFENASEGAGKYFNRPTPTRGAAAGDYDNDGLLDIALNMINEPAVLLHNEFGPGHHWLMVQLEGTESNRDGIGAIVTATAAGAPIRRTRRAGESFGSSCDPRLHFGLGKVDTVEELAVEWPSGVRDVLRNVPANQILTVVEGKHPAGGE